MDRHKSNEKKTKKTPGSQPGSQTKIKNKGGRPKSLKECDIDLKQLELVAGWGHTDEEIAMLLGIATSTYYLYKQQYTEFSEAIKRGKLKADSRVVQSLFHRAVGYSHPEDKIFLHEGDPVIVPTTKHYPPDTAACFIWLKNRQGWRDKIEHSGNISNLPYYDYSKLSDKELEEMEKILKKAESTK